MTLPKPKAFEIMWRKQAGRCHYCGLDMVRAEHIERRRLAGNAATRDHLLPRSRGGRSGWANIVLCCNGCNLRKGNRTAMEFVITEGLWLFRRGNCKGRMTPIAANQNHRGDPHTAQVGERQ